MHLKRVVEHNNKYEYKKNYLVLLHPYFEKVRTSNVSALSLRHFDPAGNCPLIK